MDTLRDPWAAPPPPRDSRFEKWLLVIVTVLAGLALTAACALGGLFVLTRTVPGSAGQAAGPTPWPVAVSSPTPARGPQPTPAGTRPALAATGPAPATAATQPAAASPGTYFAVADYPGPPGAPRTVTLPPAVTDRQKLDEAQRLYEQGQAAFDAQRWQESIPSFDKALALNPRHAEAYMFRGAAYRHIGNTYNMLETYLRYYDLSIVDFTRSTAANPAWWRAYNNRGASYSARAGVEPLRSDRRKWYELALDDYVQASQLDATQPQPWLNRAIGHINLGQCDQALEELQKSQPWTTATLVQVARAYRCKGSLKDALNVIQQAIATDPGDPTLYVERSLIYLASGEYAKSLEDADTAADKWQGQFVPGAIWYDKAAAEYYLGHYDKGEEYVLTGRRYTWIDWGDPYYYLGMVYLKRGKTQEAIEALQWAEQTLDEGSKLLPATRAELQKLKQ